MSTLPDHLVELAAGGWSLWRWFCLRSPGFPARRVLALGAPEAAAVVDELLAAEDAALAARAAARAWLHDALQRAVGDQRRTLDRVFRRLKAGPSPEVPADEPDLAAVLRPFAAAETIRVERARAAEHQLEEAWTRGSGAIREVAASPRFREALTWQNPGALHTGLDPLLAKPAGATDSKTRQHEAMVASYLQRYSVKNDTIGFFGPVGWARFSDATAPLALRTGPSLLAKRTVYFERWGLAALAEQLSTDDRLRRELCPRQAPRVRLEGRLVRLGGQRASELPADFAAALASCDGRRSARTIVADLRAQPELAITDDEAAYALLEELTAQRLLRWELELPTGGGPRFELFLRQALANVPDVAVRERGMAVLDELEAARAKVAQAAGDTAALGRALGELEELFARSAGAAASRKQGQVYAGRKLVYEECRRDLDVTVGEPVIRALGPPLALLLSSARWFTHTIARRFRPSLETAYQRACDATGTHTVELARVIEEAADPAPIVNDAVAELQRRWSELLGLDEQSRAIACTEAALRTKVAAAFEAPSPGWPLARHISPDFLIAARGAEALSRGDFQLVLGEIHVGFNTPLAQLFLQQHPRPDELIAHQHLDVPGPTVGIAMPAELFNRAVDFPPVSGLSYEIEVGLQPSSLPRTQVRSVGDLVAERRDGRLELRSRDGSWRVELFLFFETRLIMEAGSRFHFLPPMRHRPRVTVDRLVIAREQWTLDPEQVAFAHRDRVFDRFAGARRLVRDQALPRFVFCKVPEEPKPFYVDFASPHYVDAWARVIRRASSVTLTEMLPSLEELWLPDANGDLYTCELRAPIVDPIGYEAG